MPKLKLPRFLPDFRRRFVQAKTPDAAITQLCVQNSCAQAVHLSRGGAVPTTPPGNLEATTDHDGCPFWVRT